MDEKIVELCKKDFKVIDMVFVIMDNVVFCQMVI